MKTEADFVNEGFSPEELQTVETYKEAPEPVSKDDDGDTPDAVEAQPQAQQQQPDEPKMVDIRAVQEARSEARALREELAREKANQARIDERLKIMDEHFKAQQQPAKKEITFDEDPLEYIKHNIDTNKEEVSSLKKQLEARAEQDRQASEEQTRFRTTINEADAVLNVVIQNDPKIKEAIDYSFEVIRGDIAAELERQQIPVAQRQQVGEQWYLKMVGDLAVKCPRDPALAAEFVNRTARYYGFGYQQPSQQAQIQQQQATPQELAERQSRHMSLSNASGGEAPKAIDAKAIGSMSDKEFSRFMSSMKNRSEFDKILGAE